MRNLGFNVLDTPKNQRLESQGRSEDRLRAYRTQETLWGLDRTVVITFNPVTKRKKIYDLTKKLDRIRAELLEYRRKYNAKMPQWRKESTIKNRYLKLC